jgi:ribosome-binding protein aMBF1 (putative translation factor)
VAVSQTTRDSARQRERRDMQDLAKKFGDIIREKRLQLGVSQDALALMAEIDRSYVGRIERGEVNVTLEKAYELARALRCDIRDLLP